MRIDIEKQIWKHDGKNFAVEVVRWVNISEKFVKDNLSPELKEIIPDNHWNVYAYIYPKHPLFDRIKKDSLFDYGFDLPLHWGASYHKWIYDSRGKVNYKQIGSDYQHLHDDCFGKYNNKKEAWEIFKDADELIETLQDNDVPKMGAR